MTGVHRGARRAATINNEAGEGFRVRLHGAVQLKYPSLISSSNYLDAIRAALWPCRQNRPDCMTAKPRRFMRATLAPDYYGGGKARGYRR
jgi:hypothetical protein